jgi:hypothetical protein
MARIPINIILNLDSGKTISSKTRPPIRKEKTSRDTLRLMKALKKTQEDIKNFKLSKKKDKTEKRVIEKVMVRSPRTSGGKLEKLLIKGLDGIKDELRTLPRSGHTGGG